MTIDDNIKDEKLSSGKIDKYEYSTGGEILPPDQSRIIDKVSLLIFI